MNSNTGGLITSAMDSTALPNQKQDTLSIQRRMLTQSEIELLQKDKKESLEKMTMLFNNLNLRAKITEKL